MSKSVMHKMIHKYFKPEAPVAYINLCDGNEGDNNYFWTNVSCSLCLQKRTPYTQQRGREFSRGYREAHLEKVRLRDRLSFKRRYPILVKKRDYSTPNVQARALLSRAVVSGKIIKPVNCDRCGMFLKKQFLQGHHHDYRNPYDVEWLCAPCHGLMHRKEAALTETPELLEGKNV